MMAHVNEKVKEHVEAEHADPPEPSQVIELPHPGTSHKSRTDVDWPKTIRNAVYIAAAVGPLAAAILALS
jgi:hypothetical protein